MPFGETDPSRWSIVVHGGAGDIDPSRERDVAIGCESAAAIGAAILRAGGAAIDAVQAAVIALEDDARFNAGKGACLNEDGLIELDAAIIEGTSLRAGAVAAMSPFPNPIAIARRALEDGKHVLYAGEGAARFARAHGFAATTAEALTTERAKARWLKLRGTRHEEHSGGTVGAVARDAHGHVASATSTGGTIDKRAGRVGDTPLLGAGTYADDAHGAASTTGKGESFMRVCFAVRAVDAIDRRPGLGANAHARLAAMTERVGGVGGVIVVDSDGRAAWAHVSRSMAWALVRSADAGPIEESRASA